MRLLCTASAVCGCGLYPAATAAAVWRLCLPCRRWQALALTTMHRCPAQHVTGPLLLTRSSSSSTALLTMALLRMWHARSLALALTHTLGRSAARFLDALLRR